MSEINEDLPLDEGVENSDLAQLSQADSLIDRGVADPLDEGFVAPDHWSAAQRFGNTPAEMAQGETIDQRVAQEEPEPSSDPEPDWNPNGEQRQVGSTRAGRLVAPGDAMSADTESQAVASDVGISGGAASAEEAAMHIINEEDLAHHGDEDNEPAGTAGQATS